MPSNYWLYFKKSSPTTATCKKCLKNIKTSGNTSNLKKHLKVHGINLERKINNVDNSKSNLIILEEPSTSASAGAGSISKITDSSNLQEKNSAICDNKDTPSPSCSFSSEASEGSIIRSFHSVSAYKDGGSKHSAITNALMYFICADNRPYYAIEGRGFKKLMKTVVPLYKLPSRETIKKKIDDKYEFMQTIYKEKLANVEYFCLTTDIWSEMMTVRSFLGVTAHFILNGKHKSAIIAVKELDERHTAEHIAEQIKIILNSWDISLEKIVAIVTDNGANMIAAVRILATNHISCFAHLINLVAEKSLANPEISALINKVRNIVKWIKNSVNISDDLRRRQKNLDIKEGNIKKVILDVKTRWNSCYYMIKRFIELASLISEIHFGKRDAPPMPSAQELEIIKDIIVILKPLEYITKEVSGENYITASRIIPMINCALYKYKNTSFEMEESQQFNVLVLTEMRKRIGSAEHVKPLAIATILDPRFKNIHFQDPQAAANVMTYIKKILQQKKPQEAHSESIETRDLITNEETGDDFWSFHKTLAQNQLAKHDFSEGHELTTYLATPVTSFESEPLEFWKETANVHPNLSKIALKYMCLVATSVPSERLFSDAGATLTQSRNRLLGKRVGKLLFLGSLSEEDWF